MFSRRRVLLAGLAVLPQFGLAQEPNRRYRVGWLATTKTSFDEPYGQAFVKRLGELGFVEGRNLELVRRHADSRVERLPALADEVGKLKLDALFGGGSEANLATMVRASKTAPIVMIAVDFDPV